MTTDTQNTKDVPLQKEVMTLEPTEKTSSIRTQMLMLSHTANILPYGLLATSTSSGVTQLVPSSTFLDTLTRAVIKPPLKYRQLKRVTGQGRQRCRRRLRTRS